MGFQLTQDTHCNLKKMDSITHFLNINLKIIKKTCDDSSINFIKEMLELCDAEKTEKEIAMKFKNILQIIDKTNANIYTKLLGIFGLLVKVKNVNISQIDCKRAYVIHEFSFVEFSIDMSTESCDEVSDCKYLNQLIAFCESGGKICEDPSWVGKIVNIIKHVKDDSIQPMMKLMCVIGILEESMI